MLRCFAWVLLLTALLPTAACAPSPQADVAEPTAVQVFIAADDFYVGAPRVPFLLRDGADPAVNLRSVEVWLFDLTVDPPTAVWNGPARAYTDYEVPYWTASPAIPRAGDWGLLIEATTADGQTTRYQRTIAVTDAPRSPAIGSRPPALTNRTTADTELGLLSSGVNPLPALYDQTVAAALQTGRPTVVMFATPAFCKTAVCAPVVRSLEALHDQVGERANLIHLEVYKDFQTLAVADEMTAWGLTTEPWTFVLDRSGAVTARLGGPVSPTELLEQLTPLLEG